MADNLQRQMQEIALGVQEEAINLLIELCDEALRKPNLASLQNRCPKNVGEEVVGRILEIHKIEFLFQSEESMFSILRRGPWSFNDWMCVIQRWTKLHSDAEFKRIPFWIQIRGIPLRFLTARIITSIGERMGLFLETNFGRDVSVLKFQYEKLRNFCTTCGMLSHDASECPTSGNQGPHTDDDDDDDNDANEDHPDVPGDNPDQVHGPMNQQHPEESTEDEHQNAPKRGKLKPLLQRLTMEVPWCVATCARPMPHKILNTAWLKDREGNHKF
ncbi:Zinc knuckle CX2CX4HX4C [Arabidopsis suecica]|uniref:Zinc knuckle CX2CX4HX4C n=1 Tax=Arabidopsis suecica TaxID=45249 RepID=A0A8T2FCJ4_ARASU|nr:Zinc knuckle CX2CX4HX4C [Arabidopsis suecica]